MSDEGPPGGNASPEKVGVYGGTFDPPHLAHLVLAETARDQLGLERVLLVVAGEPWRKSDRWVTPAQQRLEMVRLAIADNPRLEACDIEVRRQGPSFMADTLRALSAPGRELFFVLGEDAARDLPNWRRPDEIVRLATLAVAPRGAPRPPKVEGARVLLLDMPRLQISSTGLRLRVREGRSIRYLVPPPVEAYIKSSGLYGRRPGGAG